ncbi:MAG: molecular chaperone DnaK [Myxococcales bacterium]|nr:molecular chaperone DnaK [Myxococcales bacterium]
MTLENGKLCEHDDAALVTCMKHHLTTDQIIELRAELQRQLVRLEQSMRVTEKAVKIVELDQTAVGRLSRMDSLQNQSLSKGLREREVARLSQLREAISRIEKETFGLCIACGGEIPYERLFVFPEAPACGECQI